MQQWIVMIAPLHFARTRALAACRKTLQLDGADAHTPMSTSHVLWHKAQWLLILKWLPMLKAMIRLHTEVMLTCNGIKHGAGPA